MSEGKVAVHDGNGRWHLPQPLLRGPVLTESDNALRKFPETVIGFCQHPDMNLDYAYFNKTHE